jgi:hypothetical protein
MIISEKIFYKKEVFLPINVIRSEKWQIKIVYFRSLFHFHFQSLSFPTHKRQRKSIIFSFYTYRKLDMFFRGV